MPQVGRAPKRGGRGGLLAGIIVAIVILAGAGVGGYFWNRSSAISTTRQYVDASMMAILRTGRQDDDILERVLVKEQAARIEQARKALSQRAKSPLDESLIRSLTSAKGSYEIGKATVGLKEATVDVKETLAVGARSFSLDVEVALVREGIAWKVDDRETARKTRLSTPPTEAPGH